MELEKKGRFILDEPLSLHNSLHIGGKARYFFMADDKDDVSKGRIFAVKEEIPILIIGNGSNILFSDEGFSGLVISTQNMNKIEVNEDKVIAKAGANLSDVIKISKEYSLSGIESLIGIPGSVGGASIMNASAFGSEIGEFIRTAKVLRDNIEVRIEDISFGYRKSSLSDEIVLEIEFLFEKKEKKLIENKIVEIIELRRKKQPVLSDGIGTCGSVFKNPEGYSAGELIEKAGLKGMSVGGVRISDKHCNYFLTERDPTSKDFVDLANKVRDKVKRDFGITLELEVKVIGKEKEEQI